MINSTDPNLLDSLVGRIFNIDSIQHGTAKDPYLVRYTGRLRGEDSVTQYDQLAGLLKPYGLMPLFRREQGRQVVLVTQDLPAPRPSNPWVNLLLFLLTILSVLFTGAVFAAGDSPLDFSPTGILHMLGQGWPFAASLLLILTAHEFGHYLVGRFHHAPVSLPYFIPLPYPLGYFGTMGAFINMKAPVKNRRQLLDVGIAGPLAGFLVAVPVLIIGLSLSRLDTLSLPTTPGMVLTLEGNSILYLASKFLVFGRLLPSPITFGGLGPLLYWLRFFFTGTPFPVGGIDVTLHPVAWAGWAGLLVTALNLIPAGQLDGGHLLYTLLGSKNARRVYPFVIIFLFLLGFAWNGWWLWAALIFLLVGRSYAEPLDQITPLNPARKVLAAVGLILFILVFTPVPLQAFSA